MLLMLFGRLFHVFIYFSVKWSVVCVGVRVFEYWFVFGCRGGLRVRIGLGICGRGKLVDSYGCVLVY